MKKSCDSQQRVCFSEKSEMMGVFFPKKDAWTTIWMQSHNLSKRRSGTQRSQECINHTCIPTEFFSSTIQKQVPPQIHHCRLWKYRKLDAASEFPKGPCHCAGQGGNSLWRAVCLTRSRLFSLLFLFCVHLDCGNWLACDRRYWTRVRETGRQTETGCTARLAAQTAQDLISLCDIYA